MISIVVSVYNEELLLPRFWKALEEVLGGLDSQFEVLFVNDGSRDGTRDLLRALRPAAANVQIRHLEFTRNFGHEAAMCAGIDHAEGEAVICLDADLQHPPQMIPAMLTAYRSGAEVVLMKRENAAQDDWIASLASRAFYWLINRVSEVRLEPAASDFFLISRPVVQILTRHYRTTSRFVRGVIQGLGFRTILIPFQAGRREGGSSRYSKRKLVSLSLDAVVSFSKWPLRIATIMGLVIIFFSLLLLAFSVAMKMVGYVIPGYTTIVCLILMFFALQFFFMGLVGEYVGALFEEALGRPLYVLKSADRDAAPDGMATAGAGKSASDSP